MVIYNNLLSTLEFPVTPRSFLLTWHTRKPRVNAQLAVLLPLMINFVTVYTVMNEGTNRVDRWAEFFEWGMS